MLERLSGLRAVWAVDEGTPEARLATSKPSAGSARVLCYVSGVDTGLPLYNQSGAFVAEGGSELLGWGFRKDDLWGLAPLPNVGGRVQRQRTSDASGLCIPAGAEDPVEVTRTIAGRAHKVTVDPRFGGLIHQWEIDGVEFLNHGGGYTRSLQPSFCWSDLQDGSLTLHRPGLSSYYADGPDPREFGAVLSGKVIVIEAADRTTISMACRPIDYDPDGFFSGPGLEAWHGGNGNQSALWPDLWVEQTLELRDSGAHRYTTTLRLPYDIETTWFDVDLAHQLCVREDLLDTISVRDFGNGTSFTQAWGGDDQVFYDNGAQSFEDDAGLGATRFPSGRGYVHGRQGAGNTLGIAIGQKAMLGYAGPAYSPAEPGKRGNCLSWARGGGASGAGASARLCHQIGHRAILSGRFHTRSGLRTIASGVYTLESWIGTELSNDMEAVFQAIP